MIDHEWLKIPGPRGNLTHANFTPNLPLSCLIHRVSQPSGTVYNKLVAYDLARLAMTGILTKTGVAPKSIEYVLMGTVIQEVKNQNIARDAGLAAGIPRNVPSHTVTQACISSNQAICTGINLIQTGQADVIVAGGVGFSPRSRSRRDDP